MKGRGRTQTRYPGLVFFTAHTKVLLRPVSSSFLVARQGLDWIVRRACMSLRPRYAARRKPSPRSCPSCTLSVPLRRSCRTAASVVQRERGPRRIECDITPHLIFSPAAVRQRVVGLFVSSRRRGPSHQEVVSPPPVV